MCCTTRRSRRYILQGWGGGHIVSLLAFPSPLGLRLPEARSRGLVSCWGSVPDPLDPKMTGLFSTRRCGWGPRPDPGSHPFSLPPLPPQLQPSLPQGPHGPLSLAPLGARLKLLLGMETTRGLHAGLCGLSPEAAPSSTGRPWRIRGGVRDPTAMPMIPPGCSRSLHWCSPTPAFVCVPGSVLFRAGCFYIFLSTAPRTW